MTQPELTARLSEQTPVHLGQSSVSQIEGRHQRGRQVTVDELVALAVALDVNPFVLLAPAIRGAAADVTGQRLSDAQVRDWLLGTRPLPGQDEALFKDHRPDHLLYVSGEPTALPTAFRSFELALAELRRESENKDRAAVATSVRSVRMMLDGCCHWGGVGHPLLPQRAPRTTPRKRESCR